MRPQAQVCPEHLKITWKNDESRACHCQLAGANKEVISRKASCSQLRVIVSLARLSTCRPNIVLISISLHLAFFVVLSCISFFPFCAYVCTQVNNRRRSVNSAADSNYITLLEEKAIVFFRYEIVAWTVKSVTLSGYSPFSSSLLVPASISVFSPFLSASSLLQASSTFRYFSGLLLTFYDLSFGFISFSTLNSFPTEFHLKFSIYTDRKLSEFTFFSQITLSSSCIKLVTLSSL